MELTKASGSQKRHKGDLKSQDFLIEQKDTNAKSMSIKKDWLEKISEEARQKNKIPAMAITIDGLSVFIISKYDFLNYKRMIEDER